MLDIREVMWSNKENHDGLRNFRACIEDVRG